MSHYFPHPEYAEDQTLSHTILTTHVLYRGFQTGALIGGADPLVRALYRRIRPAKPLSTTTAITTPKALLPQTLRATGTGGLYGIALISAGLVVRMWGREEIEWQDRSWRLLENEGQVSVDAWSIVGMGVGAVGFVLAGRRGRLGAGTGASEGLGAVGLGSLLGTAGSMEWRGMKWWLESREEKKRKEES